MEHSQLPAPDLVNGLRRLVLDIATSRRNADTGLESVCCGTTELLSFCRNTVQYVHEPVTELAADGSFERVVWLLLHGELPSDEELGDLQAILTDAGVVDPVMSEVLSRLPIGARPLDLFPFCISLSTFFDPVPQDHSPQAARSRFWRLMAQLPLLVATGLDGGSLSDAAESPELSWSGRLLHLVRGTPVIPTPAEDRAMNIVMICECITMLRPACFSARLSAASASHLPTALQNASAIFVAQLRNDPFQWAAGMLRGLNGPKSAEAWWIRREGAPMPFGFSTRSDDPRPGLLADVCMSLLGSSDRIVMEASARRLERILLKNDLHPTTDWMAARVLTLLDVPSDRQALVVAFARLAGWAAQALEQSSMGVSLLPDLQYAGLDTFSEASA